MSTSLEVFAEYLTILKNNWKKLFESGEETHPPLDV